MSCRLLASYLLSAMFALRVLLKLWYLWVAFGLPPALVRKMRRDWNDHGRPLAWRAGRMAFFAGILIWCPYVLFARLLGLGLSIVPVAAIHTVCLYGGLAVYKTAERQAARRLPETT